MKRSFVLSSLLGLLLGTANLRANHRALFDVPLYGVTFFRNELIQVDPATGMSTLVATLSDPISGYGLVSRYGRLFSFNPTAGEIIEINPLTGEVGQATSVGLSNLQGEGDLAFRSDGIAFLTTALDNEANPAADLYAVDVLGGTSERIGSTGRVVDALAFDGNDVLYAIAQGSDHLYTVDQGTGTLTEVGSLGVGINSPFASLSFAPDGVLYAAIDDRLFQVDTVTGAATAVNSEVLDLGYSSVSGLSFQTGVPDRQLFALSFFSGELARVDPVTGGATIVGTNQAMLSGFGLATLSNRLYTFDATTDHVHEIDPGSGLAVSTNDIQIPKVQGEGDIAFRSDGTGFLSAALDADGNPASSLFSFDLTAGTSERIGDTGITIDALAFDSMDVLYALAQAQGKLYTVNQTNASLTIVGTNLTVAMNSPFAALTFTADQRLLAAIDDRLYSINTMTGNATPIDTNVLDIGYSSISGLASAPVRRLGITQEGTRLVLFFNGLDSRLQSAPAVTGPYTDLADQSDLQLLTEAEGNRFYRLRRPGPGVTATLE